MLGDTKIDSLSFIDHEGKKLFFSNYNHFLNTLKPAGHYRSRIQDENDIEPFKQGFILYFISLSHSIKPKQKNLHASLFVQY